MTTIKTITKIAGYKATDGQEFSGDGALAQCKAHQAALDNTATLKAILAPETIDGLDEAQLKWLTSYDGATIKRLLDPKFAATLAEIFNGIVKRSKPAKVMPAVSLTVTA